MTSPHGFVEQLAKRVTRGDPLVSVTLVEAVGSTPQDAGSKMLVGVDGLITGTVGGGRVEHQAIQHACAMLAGPPQLARTTQLIEWNLQRDVGMTCGGVVKLLFELYNHSQWRIAIFGAGHVAASVIYCLLPLECRTVCFDPRSEWLDKLPNDPRLEKRLTSDPPAEVASLPEDSFVLCMTMGHRTDRPILAEIFRQQRTFPFLGVIGSRSKRAVLRRELLADGASEPQIEQIACPIGLALGTNHPGEIAVSIVAQLIQVRDTWRAASVSAGSARA